MRLPLFLLVGCAFGMVSACYEPPYRYDVRGNGQGGVVIQKVPKEQPAPAAPAPPPPPAPVVTPPAPPPPLPTVDQKQRIEELESRVRDLSAENEKLKMQTTRPVPATNP